MTQEMENLRVWVEYQVARLEYRRKSHTRCDDSFYAFKIQAFREVLCRIKDMERFNEEQKEHGL